MTTLSPAASPSTTSTWLPSLWPMRTSRGWNFPSPSERKTTLLVPELITASAGTRTALREASLRTTSPNISGLIEKPGLGKASRTLAARVLASR